jgi:hypothetical protein
VGVQLVVKTTAGKPVLLRPLSRPANPSTCPTINIYRGGVEGNAQGKSVLREKGKASQAGIKPGTRFNMSKLIKQ